MTATRDRPGPPTFLAEPVSLGADLLRHGLALVIVVALGIAIVLPLTRVPSADEASEVDDAVLLELPPADASSAPASPAAEGPRQQAVAASAAQKAPEQVEPPKDTPEPTEPADEAKPVESPAPADTPPPPVAPDPPAVLERKQEAAPTPPKPVEAPAATAREELAPSGSTDPAKTEAANPDEGHPHASKHAITLWQRSLLRRLEQAKRRVDSGPHATGTVSVAFTIDASGALASAHVARASGSTSLDREALSIVRQAAPFPAPPAGSGTKDMSFVLPIRFH